MEKDLEEKLKYLKLTELLSFWDETMAQTKNTSYTAFIKQIIDREVNAKRERSRLQRIRIAKIEENLLIETYPFDRQPGIAKKDHGIF